MFEDFKSRKWIESSTCPVRIEDSVAYITKELSSIMEYAIPELLLSLRLKSPQFSISALVIAMDPAKFLQCREKDLVEGDHIFSRRMAWIGGPYCHHGL